MVIKTVYETVRVFETSNNKQKLVYEAFYRHIAAVYHGVIIMNNDNIGLLNDTCDTIADI